MSEPTSNDPNKTSGRAAATQTVLSYPIHEDIPIGVRLRFTKYSRMYPKDAPTEDTTAVLSFPMPMSIVDSSGLRMNSEDLGALGLATWDNYNKLKGIAEGMDGKSPIQEGVSVVTDYIKSQQENFKVSSLRGLALAPGIPDRLKNVAKSFAGVVQNPHTTMLFDGVNLKGFNLEWRLSPRSQEESDRLHEMLKKIKMQIHPEEMPGGLALDYPDLVYVEFFGKVKEYMPKYQRAFVLNFTWVADSGSGPAFFNSGAPVAYNIQLQCQELSIVTRNTLRDQNGQ